MIEQILNILKEYVLEPLKNSRYKYFAPIIVLLIFVFVVIVYTPKVEGFTLPFLNNFNSIDTLKVVAIFQTEISEPWDGAIHKAIEEAVKNSKTPIHYEYRDNIGSADSRAKIASEYCQKGYKLIVCDAFGAERELRYTANLNQGSNFLLGSELGPTEPNVAVFDNWIHESAYLAGMWAGAISKTKKIGIVAGKPISEVNRLINAFVLGAKKIDPSIKPYIEYINSWYDPSAASDSTENLIAKGVDVFYAERDGVINSCQKYGIPVFGNIIDQSNKSEMVVASVIWDMQPTINHVFKLVQRGDFYAEDFSDWSMLYKEGTKLLPDKIISRWVKQCDANEVEKIIALKNDIKSGSYRVPIVEINMQPYY